MKTLKLKLNDFARLFQTDTDDIPLECRTIVEERDFRYRMMAQSERDELITDIMKRIDSDELTVAGPHRQPDWEQGWAENLEEFERTRDIYALTPKFVKPNQAKRLDRDYVIPYSERFEFYFVDVLRRWLFYKYLKDKSVIYEFGCGSCQHLALLAEMFPEKRLYGLDWAVSSIDIVNKLAETNGWNMEGRIFNLFEPDNRLKLRAGSAVFTVGTMEQLGCNFEPFLQYLLSNPVSLCLHLETIRELYDDRYLSDYLAIKFNSKRGYLNGFLPRLQELEREGRVEILRAQRVFFGSLYHDCYSLIVWRKTNPRHDSRASHYIVE